MKYLQSHVRSHEQRNTHSHTSGHEHIHTILPRITICILSTHAQAFREFVANVCHSLCMYARFASGCAYLYVYVCVLFLFVPYNYKHSIGIACYVQVREREMMKTNIDGKHATSNSTGTKNASIRE